MADKEKRDSSEVIEKRGQKRIPTTPPPVQSKDAAPPPPPKKQ
jgi:hypothetical protein